MLAQITKFIRKPIAWTSKNVYCAIYGNERENTTHIRMLRFLLSFLSGILFAYLMWLLVAINVNVRQFYGHVVNKALVRAVFILLNGVLYVLSRNVRVVTLLIFVSLLGREGRRYFRAIAFAFIIAGPIANLVKNAGEVARVFACTTELTYNLTKTRFDLLAKPFSNTLQNMSQDLAEIQDSFKELQEILSDLKYAVKHSDIETNKFSDYKHQRAANISVKDNHNNTYSSQQMSKASDLETQFLRNLRNRCKHQLRSGLRVCKEVFLQGYRKCGTNFPDWLASAICWPYRVDVICKINMFGKPDKICDASKVVPDDFGKTYFKMLQAEHELFYNGSSIAITYQLQNISTIEQLRSAKATSKEFIEDFEKRLRVFHRIMLIMEKFLCLIIFGVFYTSMQYHYCYRVDIEFDNIYITDYFKHIDARRKSAKLRSVLPLRNHEKSQLVDVDQMCKRTQKETTELFCYMVQLSLEIVTAGLFLLLDHMVVSLLLIIHQRSQITFQQEGEHEVRFRINGTGLMARLLRATMTNFNIHERVSTSLSNEECLPVARALPQSFYIKLLLLYLAIIILIYKSFAFLRIRRIICSYFYYKREKQRILFLYSNLLRNRYSYFDELRKRAEENMASRHVYGEVNLFFVLRMSYPNKFGWLRKYKCAKRKCIICNALEDSKFVFCVQCGFSYCRECCRELKKICINCDELLPVDITTNNTITSDDTSATLSTYRKEE